MPRRQSPRASALFTVLFAVLLCLLPALALASSAAPSPSQQASDDELICHTSNPDECYPRVFRPTDDFQVVHDDQEIPKGLHVRLDMTSGKREAKINVPDEVPPELVGAETDQGVMVVDQEQQPQEPQVPPGAPEYETVGKVKEPQNDAETAGFFQEALTIVKSASPDPDSLTVALDSLEDISHDIYYGLKIAEDTDAVKALLCLMAGQDASGKQTYDQKAASVLAGTLSNNPTALKEMAGSWALLMDDTCPGASTPLGNGFYSSFVPADSDSSVAAKAAKAKVSVINGLVKSDAIRADFLAGGGMKSLLEVLVPEGKEWAPAQRKVGQLALDNFLDEDMGATLGQWPTAAKADDETCRLAGADEGCWDYHVARIMKANKGDGEHWSRDLNDRLAAVRRNAPVRGTRDEL